MALLEAARTEGDTHADRDSPTPGRSRRRGVRGRLDRKQERWLDAGQLRTMGYAKPSPGRRCGGISRRPAVSGRGSTRRSARALSAFEREEIRRGIARG